MVKERNTLQKVIIIRDSIKMDNQMVKGYMYGKMDILMKVNFRMDYVGELDFGNKKLIMVFHFIEDNIKMIKRMVKDIIDFQMELNMLVIL
jgi:hypothetical protein